jgi:hypothetical protein
VHSPELLIETAFITYQDGETLDLTPQVRPGPALVRDEDWFIDSTQRDQKKECLRATIMFPNAVTRRESFELNLTVKLMSDAKVVDVVNTKLSVLHHTETHVYPTWMWFFLSKA